MASDPIVRTKNFAFWLWEYQRRNPHYIKYTDKILEFILYFKEIGELDYIASEEYREYLRRYSEDDERFPGFERFREKHGENAALKLYKYGTLVRKSTLRFQRPFKHHSIGIDSGSVLRTYFTEDEDIDYLTDDHDDIVALLKFYDQWNITINGNPPPDHAFSVWPPKNIRIAPKAMYDPDENVGLEFKAVKFLEQTHLAEPDFYVTEAHLEAIHELCLKDNTTNRADHMRLVLLWLWDKSHESGEFDQKKYDYFFNLIREGIKEKGYSRTPWTQIVSRKKRIDDYFEVTCRCIQKIEVLPFNNL